MIDRYRLNLLLSSGKLDEEKHYWLNQIQPGVQMSSFPHDFKRPDVLSTRQGAYTYSFSADVLSLIRTISNNSDIAAYVVLLAGVFALLHTYIRQTRLMLGMPVLKQPGDRGYTNDLLAVSANIEPEMTFQQLLMATRSVVVEANKHSNYPLDKLFELLHVPLEANAPLVPVIVLLENIHAKQLIGEACADLVFSCRLTEKTMDLCIEYNAHLYREETVARLATHLGCLLARALAHSQGKLTEISLLTAEEKELLLRTFNDTAAPYPKDKTLHQLFEEQVARTPDRLAVIAQDEQLTYSVLEERANRLAHTLRKLNVAADAIVGVCLERSVEMIVSLFAILKAGGAYLPIDPKVPAMRLAHMLSNSAVSVVLCTAEHAAKFAAVDHVLRLDDDVSYDASAEKLPVWSGPRHLAYVIYTSGTTGQPKGVAIEHRSVVNRLHWMQKAYPIAADDLILQKTPYVFDVSVWELFWWACQGATVTLLAPGMEGDPEQILAIIARHQVTTMHFVPSMLQVFLEYVEFEAQERSALLSSLRQVFASGEALLVSQVKRFNRLLFARSGTKLINLYGPTEACVDVTFYNCSPCNDAPRVPIGRPIDNIQMLVLDQYLQLQPLGLVGQLCIAGDGLARGYLNRPDLTSEKFIAHPFLPGQRLYLTGDLARWLPEGELEYLGRQDQQVKIRGYRIELGEIEAILNDHPAVQEAIVLAREDRPDSQHLVAYLVPDAHCASPLRRFLALKAAPTLASPQYYELPNGLLVAGQNKGETDFLSREIFEAQTYMRHGIRLVERACIVDVGANIGLFSLFAGLHCPNATIYAFEPIPAVFDTLRLNMALYDLQAHLFACGLSHASGNETFTYYPHVSLLSGRFASALQEREVIKAFLQTQQMDNEEHEMLDELLAERLESEDIICQVRPLSEIIREYQIERIDLLKVDVEKSELAVFAGIEEDDWPKIKQIVVETSKDGERLAQVTALLERHGYTIAVERETMLQEADLYNVYALRPCDDHLSQEQPEPPLLQPVAQRSTWSSPQRLKQDVRAMLKERLPDYMIPAQIVFLESLPLTDNGKVDRRALPAPSESGPTSKRAFVPPQTELEQAIARVWQEVLGRETVGMEDNFFDLGGHSLTATKLTWRIREVFHVDLPPVAVFRNPTIRLLASLLQTGEIQSNGSIPRVEQRAYYPTTSAQKRIFMASQLAGADSTYTIPLLLRVNGAVDQKRFTAAWQALVERHETLRTSFAIRAGELVQCIHEVEEVQIQWIKATEATMDAVLEAFFQPFDLQQFPLFKVAMAVLGPDRSILMFNMHHIISDGVSINIMAHELIQLYAGHSLPPLPIAYKDFAVWQQEQLNMQAMAQQENYWLQVFAGDIPVLELPTDYPRPAVQTFAGRSVFFQTDHELLQKLQQCARDTETTLYMLLLASFAILLFQYSGQEDVIVGSPVSRRPYPELEHLIGIFVNTLALRIRPGRHQTFLAFLQEVKERVLQAFNNQDYAFERLLDKIAVRRDPGRAFLFDVVFAMQNFDRTPIEVEGLTFAPYDTDGVTTKFDLTLQAMEGEHEIEFSLDYRTSLFKQETVERMAQDLLKILQTVVDNPAIELGEIELTVVDAKLENMVKEEADFAF